MQKILRQNGVAVAVLASVTGFATIAAFPLFGFFLVVGLWATVRGPNDEEAPRVINIAAAPSWAQTVYEAVWIAIAVVFLVSALSSIAAHIAG